MFFTIFIVTDRHRQNNKKSHGHPWLYCIINQNLFSLKFKGIFQSQPFLVFITQVQCCAVCQCITFCRCTAFVLALHLRPLDADLRVVPCHAALIVWMPEIVHFIAEFCLIAQHQKSMCKSFRNQELLFIFRR